jgi:hypothetical protein
MLDSKWSPDKIVSAHKGGVNAVSWAPLLSVGPLGQAAEDDAPRVAPRLISCGCDDELKIWNFREDEVNGGWRASQMPTPVLKGEMSTRSFGSLVTNYPNYLTLKLVHCAVSSVELTRETQRWAWNAMMTLGSDALHATHPALRRCFFHEQTCDTRDGIATLHGPPVSGCPRARSRAAHKTAKC